MAHTLQLAAPEVTEGPYYHQAGHPIRSNIAEWQLGLLLVSTCGSSLCTCIVLKIFPSTQMMNIGVIDVLTCKPVRTSL